MNEKQEHLLRLLKEIDAFCREHGIRYYCSGGTVLGAIRHKGFIPWDDDIDMFIPRRDFERFVELFKEYGPSDRIIEFYEGNHEHHTPVARYHEEGTTMFMHYNMIGYSSAGILIDIFVLDPIPDGFELQQEHVAKFFAYSDLVCPVMNFSYRLPPKYIRLMDRYEAEAAKRGTDTVAMELSKELFSYDEDECDYYILRWGSLPFIMPQKMFGTPLYVDFEDTQIPIPEMWPQYLAVQYGCNWTDIPYVDNRPQHNTIYDPGRDYHEIYKIRDSLYDQKDLLKLYNGRKKVFRDLYEVEHRLEDYAFGLQVRVCMKEIENNLRREGAESAQSLFSAGEYKKILKIYAPYIRRQTDSAYVGALAHSFYYNWIYPHVIPLDEETVSCILWSIMYAGNMRQAEKIAGVYYRAGKSTEATDAILALMDQIEEAARLYYTGRYEEASAYIRNIPEYEKIPALTGYLWLSSVATGLTPEEASTLESLASGQDSSHFITKAWGDQLWEEGKKDEAAAVYTELMKTCRNGMFLWDITHKGVTIDSISLDMPAARPENEFTACQKKLFDELDEVCSKAGISYTVQDDYLSDAPAISMTSDAASKLIAAMKNSLPANRKLLSWESGSAARGFFLRYIDTDTVRINLRRPGDPDTQCIGIKISILVPDNLSRLRAFIARSLETGVKVMDADAVTVWRYASGRKGKVYRALAGLGEGQKKFLRRSAFKAYMKPVRSGNKIREDYSETADEEMAPDIDEMVQPGRRPSVFMIRSTEISAAELFSPSEMQTFMSLPWQELGRLRSIAKSYDNRILDTRLLLFEKGSE